MQRQISQRFRQLTSPQSLSNTVSAATCGIIVLVAIFFRLRLYFFNRVLWLDELLLTHNLIEKDFGDFFSSLNYGQSAPIFFLVIEKSLNLIQPRSEYLLRLFPLICGLAAVILFGFLARMVHPRAFIFLLGAFALTYRPVYYASEVKQYSSDIFIAILLMWLGVWFMKDLTHKKILLLGLIGAVSIWLSHPAIFTLAGIGISLIISAFVRREYKSVVWLGVIGIIWLAVFGLQYKLTMTHLTENAHLFEYWDSGFMPSPPWSDWNWFLTSWNKFLQYCGYSQSLAFFLTATYILGIVIAVNINWRLSLMLIIPFLITLIASYFHAYPFSRRLILFLLPGIILGAGFTLEWLISLFPKYTKYWISFLRLVLAVLLVIIPIINTWKIIDHPVNRENVLPYIKYLARNRKANDKIYLYYPAQHAFFYYGDQYGIAKEDYFIGTKSWADPKKYNIDIDQLRGNKRVWFFFVHNNVIDGLDEQDYFINYLDQIGIQKDKENSKDVSLYLYDLR
jgi:hypothetical protein